MQSTGSTELKVVPAGADCCDPSRLRVCLFDVEALVYEGAAPLSARELLHGDPVARIQQAGWVDFSYDEVASTEHGLMAVADLFGVCLYLATLPRSKTEIRTRILKVVCKAMHAPQEATLHFMEQVSKLLCMQHAACTLCIMC